MTPLVRCSRPASQGHRDDSVPVRIPLTMNTSAVARRYLLGKFGGRGRVVRVEQPGLAWTRARAAREATGEIICFLEDHHRPEPDFLSAVVQAFAERPWAGVIGGKVLPRYEAPPSQPAELVVARALGLEGRGETSQCLEEQGGGLPGAGLCVRRSILLTLASSPAPKLEFKHQSEISSIHAADLGISVAARQMGWQCWYVPALRIEHVLGTQCLDKLGLIRLGEPIGPRPPEFRPLAWMKGLGDYCRWQWHHWFGPSLRLRQLHPKLTGDFNDLQQELPRDRARQALNGKA